MMQRLLCSTVLALATMIACGAHAADVWKVSSAKGHVYVGGTFHLLTPNDYPLPPEYDVAYRNSQTLVLETDLEKLRDPQFSESIAGTLQYPAGKDIASTLKPETIRQIKNYLADNRVPFESVATLRPGILSVTLTMIELRRLNLTGTGVDEHFHLRATQDRKPIRWFESAEEQFNLLLHMGEGNEDELLIYTLKDMKNMPRLMSDMKKAWRNGDSKALAAISLDPYEDEFPALMNSLLDDRNARWMPTIESMINDAGTEYILVGALHLVGEQGLLSVLEKRGYRVEKVKSPQR